MTVEWPMARFGLPVLRPALGWSCRTLIPFMYQNRQDTEVSLCDTRAVMLLGVPGAEMVTRTDSQSLTSATLAG